jgi:hypothetical protein
LSVANTRSGVAAAWPRISVASAPASDREPSDAILAAGRLDRLAVLARQRPAQAVAQRNHVLLLPRLRVLLDLVERRDPARRLRCDLTVGRPPEIRDDIAQVEHLPLEQQQHGRDHQEAQHHGDPVLGPPRSSDGGRHGAGRCGADGCLI